MSTEALAGFLDALWGDQKGVAYLAFGHGPHFKAGKYIHTRWEDRPFSWPKDRDHLVRMAGAVLEHQDVYHGVLLRRPEGRRTKGNALPGRFAWADIDGPWTPDRQAAWERILEVAPGSMLINSGRSRHGYVALSEALPPAELEMWNRRLGRLLDADSKWAENTVLRPPGTLNHKTRVDPEAEANGTGVAAPVSVLHAGSGSGGSLDALDALLPPDPQRRVNGQRRHFRTGEEVGEIPVWLADLVDEEPDEDRSRQTARLVATALEAGLGVEQILALARSHRPTVEKYGARADREVGRLIDKFAEEGLLMEEPAGESSGADDETGFDFRTGGGDDQGGGRQPDGGDSRPDWMGRYAGAHFPLEFFPPVLRPFIHETATSRCVHPDAVAASILPIVSTCTGFSRSLFLKDDWQVWPPIWLALVMEVGSGKSPLLDELLVPIVTIDDELGATYEKAMSEFMMLPGNAEAMASEKPRRGQVAGTDLTLEALAKMLPRHPRGILVHRDELSGWAGAMGQYKPGRINDERERWLTLWSTPTRTWINRVRDRDAEPVVIDRPLVSILGGIQPAKLSTLVTPDDPDGLGARFWYCRPPQVDEDERAPAASTPARATYSDVIRGVYRLAPGLGGVPVPYIVEPGGAEEVLAVRRRLIEEKAAAPTGFLRAWWSKAPVALGRLLLAGMALGEAAGDFGPVVTPARVREADAALSYFAGQVIALAADPCINASEAFQPANPRALHQVVAHLNRPEVGGRASLRNLMHRGPLRNMDRKEALRTVREAAEKGLVTITDGEKKNQSIISLPVAGRTG